MNQSPSIIFSVNAHILIYDLHNAAFYEQGHCLSPDAIRQIIEMNKLQTLEGLKCSLCSCVEALAYLANRALLVSSSPRFDPILPQSARRLAY